MGILRIHYTEAVRAATDELPWWADGPRSAIGRVMTGEPAQELDNDGNPTGWLLMAHPGIDVWDLWLLDVVRAGWAYADSLGKDGQDLVAYQSAVDWENWEALKAEIDAGNVTPAEAEARAIANAIAQAATLGIDPPDLEDDDV